MATPEQRPLKAFRADSPDEERSVIIFARNRSRARGMIRGYEDFDAEGFLSFPVYRAPEYDRFITEGSVEILCEWSQDRWDRMYWEMGWYPDENTPTCCDCGRYEYASIPESHLDAEFGELCVTCLGKRKEDPTDAT